MILSITMNPSVDISYPLAQLSIGEVNRVNSAKKTAGGKGLNVARVVHLSKHSVIASGLLGGTIGQYIRNQLDHDHIQHDFYIINQESRNCIAILHENYQTEILESGPTIGQADQDKFKQHFERLLPQVNVITLSGSLPKGMNNSYYAELIELAHRYQKPVLLDCSGIYLQEAITQTIQPYLVKPNHEELGQLIGKKMVSSDIQALIEGIKQEKNLMRIPMVVVSLGKDGALVKYYDQFFQVSIPTINVINPVGSGDSTLAGLAIGINKNEPINAILKRAMTFGMLNAMEAQTGCVNMDRYAELYEKVKVIEIS